MRWLAGVAAAFVVACLTGCAAGAGGAAASRPVTPVIARGAPAAPSVAASGCSTWVTAPGTPYALVHISTTLHVKHASAPQAGARGLIAVSSIDVAFVSGGVQVGWATQATPQDDAAMVMGNGKRALTAVAYSIYLSGRWAPDCHDLDSRLIACGELVVPGCDGLVPLEAVDLAFDGVAQRG